MTKKPKEEKIDKQHAPETLSSIGKMLKEEKTKRQIAQHFGFGLKATKYIIDRWGLEENLIKPKLIGVGQ